MKTIKTSYQWHHACCPSMQTAFLWWALKVIILENSEGKIEMKGKQNGSRMTSLFVPYITWLPPKVCVQMSEQPSISIGKSRFFLCSEYFQRTLKTRFSNRIEVLKWWVMCFNLTNWLINTLSKLKISYRKWPL